MNPIKSIIFFFIISILLQTELFSDPLYTFEIGFRILNSQGTGAAQETITIYTLNSSSRDLEIYTSGTSASSFLYGGGYYNAICDISDNNTSGATLGPLQGGLTYYIRIANRFYIITYGGGAYGDIGFQYQQGGNISEVFNTSSYSIAGPYTWTTRSITLKNDFGGDRNSVTGKIYINSFALTSVGYNGHTLNREDRTFPHTSSGENNQYISNYYRKWRKFSEAGDNSISITMSTPNNYTRTATYARKCNISVQNDFGGSGSGGNIKFQTTQYSSPYQPAETYEDLTYSAEALSHTINSVYYTFKNWDFNSTNISTQNPITTFQPNAHGTLKAKFNGKPLNTYRNQSYGTVNYSPVVINWSKHPLDNSEITQYAIWRSVKHNGVTGTPQQIGTVTANGSSSYSFTDYDYVRTPTYVDDLLHYDVRAYYQPSAIYSDAGWVALYGTQLKLNENNTAKAEISREIPDKYEINNYPNPFNPTTVIHYQLPVDGSVTLKIYDMLGKEIAVLVNENKQAGYYNVTFDASILASGIYIYSIRANNFIQSRKMMFVK